MNALYAWIELLRSRTAITTLVSAGNINLFLPDPEIPQQNAYLTVSAAIPPGISPLRTWRGTVRLTAFAPQMHTAQAIIDAAVNDLFDPLTRFKMFHLDSGSQSGAVISITDVFNLTRTEEQLSGNVYRPAWAVDMATDVSTGALVWAS